MNAPVTPTEDLIYSVQDGIARITFNRPQARNALTFAMYEQMASICESINQDRSIKALILTGSGDKAFASGTDISQFRAFKTAQDALDYEARIDRVLGTLEATVYARKIIIAEGGAVIGSVRTNEAEVRGEFDGSMQVKGKVSFYPRSKISGKIRALDLAISAESNTNDADIKRVDAKLANEKFVANAPEEIIEGEKEKREEAQTRRAKFVEALERLKRAL